MENQLRVHRADSPFQWMKIRRLYHSAFPAAERKPLGIIRSMQKKCKSDVWYFVLDRKFAGFAATINSEKLILLDYLAVPEALRGNGVGAGMLEELKKLYAGRGLFVEIETTHAKAEDLCDRMRRRAFYERAGFRDLSVTASVFGVDMDLLGIDCALDFEGYRAFYRDEYNPWAAEHIKEAGGC